MKELDKKVNLNDDGNVVIIRTTEEVLTLEELEYREQDLERRKQRLVEQSADIKRQYDELVKEQQEYRTLITQQKTTAETKQTQPAVIDPNA